MNGTTPDIFDQELRAGELPLELMYASERNRPNSPLFTQPYDHGKLKDWTWAEAVSEVRRIAAWIEAQSFPPKSHIVILSKNSAWWIMADWAIWAAGHVTVPFFAAVRDASLKALFEHAEPVACFLGTIDHALPADEPLFQNLTYITFPNATASNVPKAATAWDDILATQAPQQGETQRDPNELATIIYTSGTTGTPKGVMHSFRSIALTGKSCMPVLLHGQSGIDRALSYLPLAHISERALIEMVCLFTPIHVFFSEGLPTFVEDLKRARVTYFFSIPRLYMRFQQGVLEKMPQKKLDLFLNIPILKNIVRKKILAGLGLQDARIVSSGSAPIPVEVVEWYLKLGLNFMEGYGMSESGVTHVPLPGQIRIGYVGSSVGSTHTRISSKGEVQIKGPMNFMGYYKRPELYAESFTEDGYFHTGDRGEIDEMNRLRLVGRLKEEFKTSKGKYVIPAQIEKDLSLSTLFESIAVFGAGMTGPFALVVLAPDKRTAVASADVRAELEPLLIAELKRVNASLEPHEQLRFMVVSQQAWSSDNNFLTPTMKVRRLVIEEKLGHEFNSWEAAGRRILWLDKS